MNTSTIVKMTLHLKSGVELQLTGTVGEADVFHKRMMKFNQGLQARTDKYRMVWYGNTVITSECVASYSVEDMNGHPLTFTLT